MEAKAHSFTHRTKVFAEDQYVTPGGLGGSAGGAAVTDPISDSEMGRDARRGVGRPSSTSSVVKAARLRKRWLSGPGKAVGEVVGDETR